MNTPRDTPTEGRLAGLMDRRRSCRAFTGEPVPRALLEQLTTLAQRAPSWCNTQPWHLTYTATPEATDAFRTKLLRHVLDPATTRQTDVPAPPGYAGLHAARRRESGFQLYEALGIARDDHERRHEQALLNFAFFGAPHVAVVTTDRALGPYALLDTGIYVAHFLLAAESLGLGAVAQGAIAHYASFVRNYFALPEGEDVLLAISFGWPDTSHPVNGFRTGRAPLVESVRQR